MVNALRVGMHYWRIWMRSKLNTIVYAVKDICEALNVRVLNLYVNCRGGRYNVVGYIDAPENKRLVARTQIRDVVRECNGISYVTGEKLGSYVNLFRYESQEAFKLTIEKMQMKEKEQIVEDGRWCLE